MATFTRPQSFNVPFLQCIIAMSSSDIPLSHLYSVKLLMASCLVCGVVWSLCYLQFPQPLSSKIAQSQLRLHFCLCLTL